MIWTTLGLIFSLFLAANGLKKDVDYLEKSFTEMDENKDEFLEPKEMIGFMTNGFNNLRIMDINLSFDECDKDQDDYLTWEEYVTTNLENTPEQMEEDIKNNEGKPNYNQIYMYDQRKWKVVDRNHDDKLSRHEYYYYFNSNSYLPILEMDYLWLSLDKNRDGKVEFLEMHDPASKGEKQTEKDHEATNRNFFDGYDKNKDGILDFKEAQGIIEISTEKNAKRQVKDLMKSADSNSDGKLSKDEFMKNAWSQMSIFKNSKVKIPALKEDDVSGPPADVETLIDFEVFVGETKEEKDEL